MSPVDKEIVKRKMAIIVRNLKALERVHGCTREEYERDFYMRKATERLLQELIEAAIDINTHIIMESGAMVPDSYYESFLELASLKILPADVARSLAPSAGLRNRLVHEYDTIDDAVVHAAVSEAIGLYTDYLRAIQRHIDAPT